MRLTSKAAVLTDMHRDWEIVEVEVDDPHPGEVRVRMEVAGLCHSDEHLKYGIVTYPVVGGHEGSGVVESVGEGVTKVAPGDHVALSWIPACGSCRWCLSGRSNLCDLGANMMTGELANGGFRYFLDGKGIGGNAGSGTLSQYTVVDQRAVVKVDPSVSLEWASLVTCSATTGWGSVVRAGEVTAGTTVAIYGCGGVGANAVRAAGAVGAGLVAVIEPVEWKRDWAKANGADLVFADATTAHAELWERTEGIGMDVAVITVGKVDSAVIRAAFDLISKGGTMVLTGVSDEIMSDTIELPGSMLALFQKRIVGSLYGHSNPLVDIPRMIRMAQDGKLDLDGLVTSRYALEDVNQGYADMLAGRNIRGAVVHEH
jgi:alcohol dehydrogenase/S-(hydroxymethyl)glutathione dehydrogenase/alcohol dehydrogenase